MNQKQLANVLIKVLGLSVCLHAIPSFIYDILRGLESVMASKPNMAEMQFFHSAAGVFVESAVALFLIIKSRNIAAFLVKNDEV